MNMVFGRCNTRQRRNWLTRSWPYSMLGTQIVDGGLVIRPQKCLTRLWYYELFTSLWRKTPSLVAVSNHWSGPSWDLKLSCVWRSDHSTLSCLLLGSKFSKCSVHWVQNQKNRLSPQLSQGLDVACGRTYRGQHWHCLLQPKNVRGRSREVSGIIERFNLSKVFPHLCSWALISEKWAFIFSQKYVQDTYESS